MKKDKSKIQDQPKDMEYRNDESPKDNTDEILNEELTGDENKPEIDGINEGLEAIKLKLDDKTKQCGEYLDMLQRTIAEFDNYKKRTAREKESLYSEAVSDTVSAFLPAVDNIERAVQISDKAGESQSIKEGIELVFRQFKDVMKKLGVEEIKSVGETFNPEIHNAVMHVEDETSGENIIVEEFQKGYMIKDKVIRHSMVKVAN